MGSINQPWAISDKYRAKYGDLWADIDFEMNRVSRKLFSDDPMNTIVGALMFGNQRIKMTLRDLKRSKIYLSNFMDELYYEKYDRDTKFEIEIKNHTLTVQRRHITRLYETITDSIDSVMKSYELGLYL